MTIDITELTKTLKDLEIKAKRGDDLREFVQSKLPQIQNHMFEIQNLLTELNPLVEQNIKLFSSKKGKKYGKTKQIGISAYLFLRENPDLTLTIQQMVNKYDCSYKQANDASISLRQNSDIKSRMITGKKFEMFYQKNIETNFKGEIKDIIKKEEDRGTGVIIDEKEDKEDKDMLADSLPKKFYYMK